MITDPQLFTNLLNAALARGGNYADVYAQNKNTRRRAVVFEEGKVKVAAESVHQEVGIRVQHGEATGYAVCEDLDPGRLMAAAHRASAIAASGGSSVLVPALEQRSLPDRYPQRRPLRAGTLAERVAYARQASEHATAMDARVQWTSVQVTDQLGDIILATSDGIYVRDARPHVRVMMSLTGAVGERRETVYHGYGARCGMEGLERFCARDLAAETVRRLDVRLRAAEAPAGEMPVVIAAGEGGIMIHEAVGHGLEADFNRKGVSAYSGKLGEMVASPLVTVFDRADLPSDSGSLNVDDEGIVPGHTTLIENGRLQGYLTDRLSARIMKVAPSGHGRRQDYSHVPHPRMRVTGLAAGAHGRDEIISSVSCGL